MFGCFIDFRKAFDLVDRDLLLRRLHDYDIKGKFLKMIEILYTKTESSICLNDKLTSWFETKFGVKQGDNLSPTLFSCFINPLIEELENTENSLKLGDLVVSVLAYADDILILSESEEGLQKQIDKLHSWCKKWRLTVNPSKTKVMVFEAGKEQTIASIKLGDEILECVEIYKYLGIIMDKQLSYKQNLEALSSSAGRAVGALISKIKSIKDIGYKSLTTLYERCICPIMEYGSAAWSAYILNSKPMMDVQYRLIRYHLGVHKFTPLLGLEGEMGWKPISLRHKLEVLRYYNRICRMEDTRWSKLIVKHSEDSKSWKAKLKSILTECNLGEHEINSFEEVNLTDCEKELTAKWHSKWSQELKNKPKLRTYAKIKVKPEPEGYLKNNMVKSIRSLNSQLLTGVLQLRIEQGRFTREKLEDRTCKLCNSGEIEDEEHFLFSCASLRDIRQDLKMELMDKCDLSWDCLKLAPNAFAKYIERLWSKRKTLLDLEVSKSVSNKPIAAGCKYTIFNYL